MNSQTLKKQRQPLLSHRYQSAGLLLHSHSIYIPRMAVTKLYFQPLLLPVLLLLQGTIGQSEYTKEKETGLILILGSNIDQGLTVL